MNNIIKEMKEAYDQFKENYPHGPVYESLPFSIHNELWMYYYLFPELLLIYNDWVRERYKRVQGRYKMDGSILTFKEYRECYYSSHKEALLLPRWVLPEEEVIRIMEECRILERGKNE